MDRYFRMGAYIYIYIYINRWGADVREEWESEEEEVWDPIQVRLGRSDIIYIYIVLILSII